MQMRIRFSSAFWLLWVVSTISMVGAIPLAGADLKLEAQLIWGTNDPKPKDSNLKPIEDTLGQKLKNSPLKWKNYFEVTRKQIAVSQAAEKRVDEQILRNSSQEPRQRPR